MASRFLVPLRGRSLAGRGDPFLSLHREMNRLFDDAFHSLGEEDREGGISIPRLDVHENEQELCITADLPGVSEADIDLRLDGDMLIIRGEKRQHKNREEGGYRLVERSSGSFQRGLRLPFEANPANVKADYENGVLTIHVPKRAQQESSRRIPVGRGRDSASSKTIEGGSGAANDQRAAERQQAASQDTVKQAGASRDSSASQQRGSDQSRQPKG
jgi:HSP20 family protein